MRSSEMGDSLERERMERRTLMASRKEVWYAIMSVDLVSESVGVRLYVLEAVRGW